MNYRAVLFSVGLVLATLSLSLSAEQSGSTDANVSTSSSAADQQHGSISGTVLDVYGDIVPGAIVTLEDELTTRSYQAIANDYGAFSFDGLRENTPYKVAAIFRGFVSWRSDAIVLNPGQHYFLTGIGLKVDGEQTSVTVYGDTEQAATQQFQVQLQQRVLGFIPNFYVVYDGANAVPLTPKLKFKLAMRVSFDPVTMAGVAFMAGIKQTANTPDFVLGAKGYGQRLGVVVADSFSDILIAGAILPTLLHQDPRYFYQGTGSTRSRMRHALFSPFLCRGDNGRLQPNYSSLGGDLASSALSNLYYPQSNRGAGLVLGNFAIGTVERMVSAFAQEFVLRKLTHTSNSNAQ